MNYINNTSESHSAMFYLKVLLLLLFVVPRRVLVSLFLMPTHFPRQFLLVLFVAALLVAPFVSKP